MKYSEFLRLRLSEGRGPEQDPSSQSSIPEVRFNCTIKRSQSGFDPKCWFDNGERRTRMSVAA